MVVSSKLCNHSVIAYQGCESDKTACEQVPCSVFALVC